MSRQGRITGWGKYAPKRVLSNHELERLIETSDEWIVTRTGIKERHIVSDEETTSTMAIEASRIALEVAQLPPEEVDLIILSTLTPDMMMPHCSAQVEKGLGAKKAGAFDLLSGCSGFVYALATAYQFISSGAYDNILVIGSDSMSRIIDWSDRSTCILFGDGAGAVLVQANDNPEGPFSFTLGSDGSGADLLYAPNVCSKPSVLPQDSQYYLKMNGREIFRFAVTSMVDSVSEVMKASGLKVSDIDLLIAHQANIRIIKAVAKSLGLPMDRVFLNIEHYGNTSAASIPMAMCEALEQGMIKKNDNIVLTAFGAGLSWAAMALQWT